MHIEKIHIDELKKLELRSVLNSMEWISIYSPKELVLLGIFNKNKELIGAFYYAKHKRAKVLTHIAPPFLSPHCGLWIDDKTSNPVQKNTYKKKVFKLIIDHLKLLNYDVISLPFPAENIDMQSFIWDGFEVSPKYTYQIDLTQTEEEILAKMSSERRKNIKKAQKEDILTQFSLKNKSSEELIENTFVKQNLRYDKEVLNSIFNNFSNDENSFSFTSFKNEKPLASVFCVCDKEVAYYILGGYDNENKHEGAGALAMWNAIKYAKKKGIKTFDFEGSMHPPIEKYFRGFGGEIVPYYSIGKANVIGKTLLKIRKK